MNELGVWVELHFGTLILNSIFSSISSYGRKSNLGAISIQNIGFILKMKTNKTNPYWKKQQPQAVFGTPGHRATAGTAPLRCMSSHQLPCPWPCPLPLGTLPSGRRECSGFSALAPLARHSNPCWLQCLLSLHAGEYLKLQARRPLLLCSGRRRVEWWPL